MNVLDLERRYWKAIQEKDLETAASLTDDPCIIAGPQGCASISKEKMMQIMRETILAEKYVLRDFEIKDEDAVVRHLSEDAVIISYVVRERLFVEGEPISLEAVDASLWVRRGGTWLCTLHTESLMGDSYGRDRKAAEVKPAA